eukprot:2063566-Heterocapsa_arctica.AAC.1
MAPPTESIGSTRGEWTILVPISGIVPETKENKCFKHIWKITNILRPSTKRKSTIGRPPAVDRE